MIIGIVGKKRHGKDTLAKIIKSYNNAYVIDRFGDDLKKIISKVFNIPENYFHSDSLKESSIQSGPIEIDKFISNLECEVQLSLKNKGLVAKTYRDLMQFVGTNYVRAACDSYWVDRVVNRAKESSNVIISDVRFPNEAEALRALGAKILRVIRIADDDTANQACSHASETEQDVIQTDLTITSLPNNLTLPTLVGFHIAKGQWDNCIIYDS